MAYGELQVSIVELATPLLKRLYTALYRERESIFRRPNSLCPFLTATSQKWKSTQPGDRVWVNKHQLSSSAQQRTSKFMPHQDGPYVILSQQSPTKFEVANLEDPDAPIGVCTSAL
ncbi:uncharacterized protein TNCV_2129751 [Trichonephila clavipes]|nr:uncharacterized protein TNCV_2129751 [Trichonephila clavipes]